MSSDTHINYGMYGGADLCDGCLVVLLDDADDGFYEELESFDEPTLRHSREKERLLTFDHPRRWKDTLPDLPEMAVTSRAGCQMCKFVRETLLRRNNSLKGPVTIICGYIWGRNRGLKQRRDDGLVLWKCEVYGEKNKASILDIDFSVETTNEDMMTWLRMDEKRSPHPLHSNVVDWVKSELKYCEDNCNHLGSYPEFIPTRLIDVGKSDADNPRLVITNGLMAGQAAEPDGMKYVTLSYCWGPQSDAAQQATTTKDNITQRCAGMELNTLSPVIRDSIIACRALSIQYLWVDALCIIQGDSQDWDRESQLMAKIYYCSYLTICPLMSSTCLKGFLEPRKPGLEIGFQSNRHTNIRGTYTLFELPPPQQRGPIWPLPVDFLDVDSSSWITRGWTFQEQALSSRLLYFGSSMCHFMCENEGCSENGFVSGDAAACRSRRFLNLALEPVDSPKRKEIDLYWEWETMRSTVLRKWTRREDIFPAMSGIAKEYAVLMDDVYLAGLWKRDLHLGLLWYISPNKGDLQSTLQQKRDQTSYIAPSWSWASQSSFVEETITRTFQVIEINRENGSPNLDTVDGFQLIEGGLSRPCHIRPEVVLKNYQLEPWGTNPYGRLKSGAFLKISGKLCPLPSDITMQRDDGGGMYFGYFSSKLGTCHLDWSVDLGTVQPRGKLMLLLIASCCSSTVNWDYLNFRSNPDEDHKGSLEEFMKQSIHNQTFTTENHRNMEDCQSCADADHRRTAWGLVVRPAEETDSYYRVGVFMLFSYSGGTEIFKYMEAQEIKLV